MESAGPPGETAGAAKVGRRPARPSGRAVLGAFLVAAAVVLVLTTSLRSGPGKGQAWEVARVTLPAGATVTPADLATATMKLGTATASDAFGAPSELVGQVVAVAVPAGQLLLRSELRAAPGSSALRPVSVTVTASDLADLAPGDLVDVLATPSGSSSAPTTVVVRGARLDAVGPDSSGSLTDSNTTVVTLGVPDLQAVEALVDAEHADTLDLVLGEPSDGTGLGGGKV